MTIASQARTAIDDTPRVSDCGGKRLERFPEIFPGIEMSPSLPGKFRNRRVNSPLTERSSNRPRVRKREESQDKHCQESYANTVRLPKDAQLLSQNREKSPGLSGLRAPISL